MLGYMAAYVLLTVIVLPTTPRLALQNVIPSLDSAYVCPNGRATGVILTLMNVKQANTTAHTFVLTWIEVLNASVNKALSKDLVVNVLSIQTVKMLFMFF